MEKIILKILILTFIISIAGSFVAEATTLSYTPVTPCKIVDTRNTSAGMIGASTDRDFHVFGDGGTIGAQGGNSAGCPAPLGEPLAAHISMVAVSPTGKGNLKAFTKGASATAGLSINYNAIDTNLANAGTIKTISGAGPDITVASNYSSAHVTIHVLGYYYPDGDLLYTPVPPCKIVDTRNTSAGMISASTQRNFHVYGSGSTISAQGGNSAGCPAPLGEPLAAHINMVAVTPTGKGNIKVFPVGGAPEANLGVNFANIGTNFANAGTVETSTGSGPDITVASNYSSAHVTIQVLGYYYYPDNFAPVPKTGQTTSYAAGDDGALQMGVQWPDPRFTDNGDGTVLDNLTGLIWLKNTDCFPAKLWGGALQACNDLEDGECGLSDGSVLGDWRLPNVKELYSLIDLGNYGPALPSGHPFTDVQSSYYWSSTTVASGTASAWLVAMKAGRVDVMSDKVSYGAYVWPVRGGND